jgi:hypothetical protein
MEGMAMKRNAGGSAARSVSIFPREFDRIRGTSVPSKHWHATFVTDFGFTGVKTK